MHPLGYFASAKNGTTDAAILSAMVSRYGDYLERLDSEQKTCASSRTQLLPVLQAQSSQRLLGQ